MAKLRTHNRRAMRPRRRRLRAIRAYYAWVKEFQDEIFSDLRRFNEEWKAKRLTWESAKARDPGLATGGIGVVTHV